MTEHELRLKYINCAKSFQGVEVGSPRHKEIINVYNSYLPHPRGFEMTYTAPWCATFVSSIAILCEMTSIFPIECSCSQQIKLLKAMGCWEENDSYRPNLGDLIYYDWDDSKNYGHFDNTGVPDHVGIVVGVTGSNITVIEGNKGKPGTVGYREVNLNGRYIRGFGLPNFASLAETPSTYVKLPILTRGLTGESVKSLQTLLNLRGANLSVDGSFGPATENAVKSFQSQHGLDADASVGPQTWRELITNGGNS